MMMHTLTRSATAILLVGIAVPVLAQDVRVRVDVSRDVATQVRDEIRTVRRDLIREIADIVRDVTVDLPNVSRPDAAFLQNRDFRSEQTHRETRRLQLGASGSLELKNISGDIVVTTGGGNDATVEIVRVSRGRTDADAQLGLQQVTVEVDQRADRAVVETHYPDNRNSRPPYSVSVSYNVTTPARTRLTANSVGGSIRVTGVRGDLSAMSVGGNVTIADAGHVIAAKTVGGTVSVNGAETDGAFEASSVGGDVTVQRVKAKRLSVNTIGGSVTANDVTCDAADLGTMSGTVEFSGPLSRGGRYELHAQSGAIRFTPTNDTGFDLQARTFSGDIQTGTAVQVQGQGSGRGTGRPNRSIRGTFGDGSAVVVLTTFSGSVVVIKK
jgi:DUF4097 and DUF4098 domain-containing protein YvlB